MIEIEGTPVYFLDHGEFPRVGTLDLDKAEKELHRDRTRIRTWEEKANFYEKILISLQCCELKLLDPKTSEDEYSKYKDLLFRNFSETLR